MIVIKESCWIGMKRCLDQAEIRHCLQGNDHHGGPKHRACTRWHSLLAEDAEADIFHYVLWPGRVLLGLPNRPAADENGRIYLRRPCVTLQVFSMVTPQKGTYPSLHDVP